MPFFEKIFTKKCENCNLNGNIGSKIHSCSSIQKEKFSKQHVRVLLFRECEKRGRKLLFDSSTVEKVFLENGIIPETNLSQRKSSNPRKNSDVVEVLGNYGYRYNKVKSDVSSIGEMMFGSVAVAYRGDNTCKIHNVQTPHQIMFTSIVNAPRHCKTGSEQSLDSSYGSSLGFQPDSHLTSCSDSKLYRIQKKVETGSGTYPILKCHFNSKTVNNENKDSSGKYYKKPLETFIESKTDETSMHRSKKAFCLNNLECDNTKNVDNTFVTSADETARSGDWGRKEYEQKTWRASFQNNISCEKEKFCNDHYETKKSLDHETDSNSLESKSEEYRSSGYGSLNSPMHKCSSLTSNHSFSGNSLTSSSSRWFPSLSTSLDISSCEGISDQNMQVNSRTKLGVSLILDLKDTINKELEAVIFERVVLLEAIMSRFVATVQTAYVQKHHFVDILYTGFLKCQESIYDLLLGRSDSTSMWLNLSNTSVQGLKNEATLMGNLYQQFQENISNIGINMKPRSDSSLKLDTKEKFLNDFCHVLAQYDTKDTNFFVSTVLTAVLTHHLSWLLTVVNSNRDRRKEMLQREQGSPMWTQWSELSGVFGAYNKSSRTIITGTEENRKLVTTIVQVLTYFIRHTTIRENKYQMDVNNILENNEQQQNKVSPDNRKCDIEIGFEKLKSKCLARKSYNTSTGKNVLLKNGVKNTYTNSPQSPLNSNPFLSSPVKGDSSIYSMHSVDMREKYNSSSSQQFIEDSNLVEALECKENLDFFESDRICSWNKSKVSHGCLENSSGKLSPIRTSLYPSIEDLARIENIRMTDLHNSIGEDKTVFVNDILNTQSKSESDKKPEKLIKVPTDLFLCAKNERNSELNKLSRSIDEGFASSLLLRPELVEHQSANWSRPVNKERDHLSCKELSYPNLDSLKTGLDMKSEDSKVNVTFLLGDNDVLENLKCEEQKINRAPNFEELKDSVRKLVMVKSSIIEMEPEVNKDVFENLSSCTKRCTKNSIHRSKTITIPVSHFQAHKARSRVSSMTGVLNFKMKYNGSGSKLDVTSNCSNEEKIQHSNQTSSELGKYNFNVRSLLPLPRLKVVSCRPKIDISSSVIGNINTTYNSEQILQGVLSDKPMCLKQITKDLSLSVHHSFCSSELSEAVCIVADVNNWDVSLYSSNNRLIDKCNNKGIQVGMSQLVSDLLESLLHLYQLKASADFCLNHIEKKLHEFYTKGQSLSELLLTTDFCSIESVMKGLDVGVNDIPLLLSIATACSPEISERYGLSFM